MTEFTLHIDIPALDRLVTYLEGLLETEAPLLPMEEQETETPQPPEPALELYTLDQVQRAAAQLRDQGKLKAVTDMFPEFAIKKLSDLKDDALQAFAGRLSGLGAKM